ncbi:hypothetical protein O6H91_10G092400 [Diphasiastrum complanatum]|uniref:Uncharacterized protein n=1 Tax=Diphasiastrum complanatum TaxID=34168 RepID=A0ACC2CJK7_DIPCM|nr:hypothetical protein O6H91_10G092400 [Diphasiastrum complanatum]
MDYLPEESILRDLKAEVSQELHGVVYFPVYSSGCLSLGIDCFLEESVWRDPKEKVSQEIHRLFFPKGSISTDSKEKVSQEIHNVILWLFYTRSISISMVLLMYVQFELQGKAAIDPHLPLPLD